MGISMDDMNKIEIPCHSDKGHNGRYTYCFDDGNDNGKEKKNDKKALVVSR